MRGSYELELVVLSVIVAMAASYTALDLARRVTASSGRAWRAWLVGGAFAMGAGIWSMHFIGMLAFRLPIRMAYDPWITLASLLIAVVTSGFALAVVCRLALISREEVDAPVLVAGGVIMGAGICGMHYTGMAAMRMAPPIEYDPLLFIASMGVAVTASVAAVWLAFTLRRGGATRRIAQRALGAAFMGLAIAGMHYTAMAAASFDPAAVCAVSSVYDVDNERLAWSIAVTMIAILALTLALPVAAVRTAPGRLP
ncbi:MAG: MHYT domain-containing protein [Nevskiaceae bacterium]